MRRIAAITAACCMSALLMTGCQSSKEKYTYRETGIQQLNAGSYEDAIQSFDQALDHSNGLVGTFEVDVLKYRAEAEYKAEDYGAAAHTYEVLVQVDQPLPEYLKMENILYIKGGELDKALAAYQAAYHPDAAEADGQSSSKSGSKSGSKDNDGKDNDGRDNGKTIDAVQESILLTLGQALTDADRFDDARTLYKQAIADGMSSGDLYNRMGLCEMEAGSLDQALEYFKKGEQLPDTGVRQKLLFNQAVVYEQKQEFAKARELLETYVSTYGSTPEVEKELEFLKTR